MYRKSICKAKLHLKLQHISVANVLLHHISVANVLLCVLLMCCYVCCKAKLHLKLHGGV
jgi:hypothetical protein